MTREPVPGPETETLSPCEREGDTDQERTNHRAMIDWPTTGWTAQRHKILPLRSRLPANRAPRIEMLIAAGRTGKAWDCGKSLSDSFARQSRPVPIKSRVNICCPAGDHSRIFIILMSPIKTKCCALKSLPRFAFRGCWPLPGPMFRGVAKQG